MEYKGPRIIDQKDDSSKKSEKNSRKIEKSLAFLKFLWDNKFIKIDCPVNQFLIDIPGKIRLTKKQFISAKRTILELQGAALWE
jgi:hypothetical protein